MLRAAVVMVAPFVVLTVLGARADVSVLSGTFVSEVQALAGLAYAASYFAAVVLAPPLLFAAAATAAARSPGCSKRRSAGTVTLREE